ncbi:RICIN domain-containing protein [Listeria sp. PSOL-1]|uniref:scabin-related ADP-ribosyltransferase n=1 Tax=Listeria sp. PSOL-1 TaxID=1844999 RepID=UPI0013D54E91|nr:RICIN domain-containing protein [Listeria sp. PSOL-1]
MNIKKIIPTFLLTLTIFFSCFIINSNTALANNNLDSTNGVSAAAVPAIAALAVRTVHNYMTVFWSPQLPAGGPYWRSNVNGAHERERLLRYDNRGPDDIFLNGFSPRRQTNDMERYTWGFFQYASGKYTYNNTPYVSTTRPEVDADGQIVRQWMPGEEFPYRYQYEIFAPGGIDTNVSLGSDSPYPDESEIVFPGGIRPEFIRSVREYRRGAGNTPDLVRIITNPSFLERPGIPELTAPEGIEVVQWQRPPEGELRKASYTSEEEKDPMKQKGSVQPVAKEGGISSTRIPDGNYFIKSNINKNSVLTDQGSTDNNVKIWNQKNIESQQWSFVYDFKKKAYKIRCAPGKILTWDRNKKNHLQTLPELRNNDQYWKLEKVSDGTYKIKSYSDPNKVIDIEREDPRNGNSILVYPYNGGGHQKWKFAPVDYAPILDGEYYIESKVSKNKLVTSNYYSNLDVVIKIWQRGKPDGQMWKFVYDNQKKAYKIKSVKNETLVLTWDSKRSNKVILFPDQGNSDQYWQAYQDKNGNYQLKSNYNSSIVLDLSYGDSNNGNNIIAYSENGGNNQKWAVNPVNARILEDGEYYIKSNVDQNKLVTPVSIEHDAKISTLQNGKYEGQTWKFVYDEQKRAYKIKNAVDPNLVLTSFGLYSPNPVLLIDFNLNEQYWRIERTEQGYYQFSNFADPTKIFTDNTNNSYKKEWQINRIDEQPIEDGVYSIITRVNDKSAIYAASSDYIELNTFLNSIETDWMFKYNEEKKAYKISSMRSPNNELFYQFPTGRVLLFDSKSNSYVNDALAYWIVEYSVKSGGYLIRSFYNPEQVLDLQFANTKIWSPIVTYLPRFGSNQIWNLIPQKS